MLTDHVPLSGYTTLRLGGPATRFTEIGTSQDLVAAVRAADQADEQLLVLGGGSNLVIADDGFAGTVVRVRTRGVAVSGAGDRVSVTAAAGENWDQLAEWAMSEKLAGIECLAGIPGLAGATPIQNVGAYGQEVAGLIEEVSVFDRATSSIAALTGPQCGFGYRTSMFKAAAWPRHPSATGRYVVLAVTFGLTRDSMSAPVRYAELAGRLGIAVGEQAPLSDVREAVLELRKGKGMVLDPADPDTMSAGSFFTNPVLDAPHFAAVERLVAERSPGVAIPRFAAGDGQVKVPAAWLIEQAGFGKGYPGHGTARISSKHTLALINHSGTTAAELVALAREIAAGVRASFGVELINEPVLVGLSM
jgi:UDP-N-acetylmuramate dehydrogenase